MGHTKNLFKYLVPFSLVFLTFRTLLLGVNCNCDSHIQATGTSCLGSSLKTHQLASFRGGSDIDAGSNKSIEEAVPVGEKFYRTLQVQIIHRHGDRTPITPLKDEDYWAKTLVSQDLLNQISSNTNVITNAGEPNTHAAGGRGVFGKLTQLGLFQLVKLGSKLREELVSDHNHLDLRAYSSTVEDGKHYYYPYPGRPSDPCIPATSKLSAPIFLAPFRVCRACW
eukprot:scaffold120_cov59-Cylindrotheca_fusiformis.AAC.7